MKRHICALALFFAIPAIPANAATKYLECRQTGDDGVDRRVYASLDDSSDKAEVESFAVTAKCAAARSCGTDVYAKAVLPSVIRLTHVTSVGGLAKYTTVIDIDRSDLTISTRTKLETADGVSEKASNGQCALQVDNRKKLL